MTESTKSSRQMLINGEHAEELRVAVVEGGVLHSYLIETGDSATMRGNVYRGVVANVEPSLDAVFVDFGGARHGFLPFHDIVPQAYHRPAPTADSRPAIRDLIDRGKPILVQVTRDAIGTKGAALTTNISLAGRYLVVLPFDPLRGLSRKIEKEETRAQLQEHVQDLALPEGFGYILRTNAAEQSKTVLRADTRALLRLWKQIETDFAQGVTPTLLYNDQDLLMQALRDTLNAEIDEIIVDREDLYDKVHDYMQTTMARARIKLSLYRAEVPLFTRFGVEAQIDSIDSRRVPLPSGGSIVIDLTEALTAIDVNSGKATHGNTQEDTAYNTNLEAAREVARQLRLRDIGGLIVVDFIDMRAQRYQRAVEKELREALKFDRARTNVGKISENGLLEINRQRLKSSLHLRTHRPCPTCAGGGLIPTPEHVGLGIIRQIEAKAARGQLEAVRISLHPELAHVIQNKRRHQLAKLEQTYSIVIDIYANPELHRVEQRVDWTEKKEAERAPAQTKTVAPANGSGGGREERRPTGRRGPNRRRGRRPPRNRSANSISNETAPSPERVDSPQDVAST